jgi:hypothetical protein
MISGNALFRIKSVKYLRSEILYSKNSPDEITEISVFRRGESKYRPYNFNKQ